MFYKILELRFVLADADELIIRDTIDLDISGQIKAMQQAAEVMGNREGLVEGPIDWKFSPEENCYFGMDSTGTIQFTIN